MHSSSVAEQGEELSSCLGVPEFGGLIPGTCKEPGIVRRKGGRLKGALVPGQRDDLPAARAIENPGDAFFVEPRLPDDTPAVG